jgi:hypothetical protein
MLARHATAEADRLPQPQKAMSSRHDDDSSSSGSGSSSSSGKDGARRAILARRAKFVAVALTGAGISVGACDPQPHVCLKVAPTPVPTVPLDAGAEPPDAGSGEDDVDAGNQASDAAVPMPCLAPPKPQVCLEFAEPPKPPPANPQPKPKPKQTLPRVCLFMTQVKEGDE